MLTLSIIFFGGRVPTPTNLFWMIWLNNTKTYTAITISFFFFFFFGGGGGGAGTDICLCIVLKYDSWFTFDNDNFDHKINNRIPTEINLYSSIVDMICKSTSDGYSPILWRVVIVIKTPSDIINENPFCLRKTCWLECCMGSNHSLYHLWPLLLTWFNFNPSMDK